MITYCQFCDDDCKVEIGGRYFCPNGHFLIKFEANNQYIEVIQPRSTGSLEGISKYRLNHIKGDFCSDTGVVLEDIKHGGV